MAITINGSGTITGISAGGLPDGSVSTDDIANNAVTMAKLATSGTLPALDGSNLTGIAGGGKVLQVVSTTKTDTSSFTSANTNTYVDLSGLSVTITPTSATSKVLVMYTVGVSQSTSATIHIRLYRGSTSIGQGASVGNRLGDSLIWRPQSTQYSLDVGPVSSSFLDSPNTTSATTYKLAGTLGSTYNGTFYINVSSNDASNDYDYSGRTASTITVMEIGA